MNFFETFLCNDMNVSKVYKKKNINRTAKLKQEANHQLFRILNELIQKYEINYFPDHHINE